MPVIAANRTGTERVIPDEDNSRQSSSLTFYGSSFITDGTGALLQSADRESDCVLSQELDLDALAELRMSWGVFRDRRPEAYKQLTT